MHRLTLVAGKIVDLAEACAMMAHATAPALRRGRRPRGLHRLPPAAARKSFRRYMDGRHLPSPAPLCARRPPAQSQETLRLLSSLEERYVH